MLGERGEGREAVGGAILREGSRVPNHRWRPGADAKPGEWFPVRGMSWFPEEGTFVPFESRLVVMCASPLHQPSS